MYYTIKLPSRTPGPGKRTTFAIQQVEGLSRITMRLEAVDAINAQFAAGHILRDEAIKQAKAVRQSLYANRDRHLGGERQFNTENLALLERYWTAEYTDRELIDRETMYQDLRRAVEACGVVSLLSGTKQDLQASVDTTTADRVNRQRRVVARLNSLLRFVGRDFQLRKRKPVRSEPRHLTLANFQAILILLPDDNWRVLARIAFATGMRLGEVFALSARSIRGSTIMVQDQIDSEHRRRDTKTRSERRVVPILDGLAAVQEWLAIPEDVRDKLRDARHANIIKTACMRAFPKESALHCCFHDLRHSYAVYLVQDKGVPLALVAQSLGNSLSVCERYYSGFVLTDAGAETMLRLLKSS